MTRYKVKLISIAKLPVGPSGVNLPLCESCKNKECGNPISLVDVSVFGVSQKIKLYKSGSSLYGVYNCDGYMPESRDSNFFKE